MKLKQAILSVMGRDALKAVIDELEIEGVDRRSVEEMQARLSRTHRATPELLIEWLGESEVKDVCELLGIDRREEKMRLLHRCFRHHLQQNQRAWTGLMLPKKASPCAGCDPRRLR